MKKQDGGYALLLVVVVIVVLGVIGTGLMAMSLSNLKNQSA